MWSSLTSAVTAMVGKVLSFLPDSPFLVLQNMSNTDMYKWIKWVNWFIPISSFISILEAWLVGIGLYYLYQIVLRWLKAIE